MGRAELVLPLWHDLSGHWTPPREVRADQPLMVLAGPPAIAPDLQVRPVRIEELDRYLPAAVAMFTEEVGVDPAGVDTNIVVVDHPDPPSVIEAAGAEGVVISAVGPRALRLVTHLDVTPDDVTRAAAVLSRLLARGEDLITAGPQVG